jgi:hypothetical protein
MLVLPGTITNPTNQHPTPPTTNTTNNQHHQQPTPPTTNTTNNQYHQQPTTNTNTQRPPIQMPNAKCQMPKIAHARNTPIHLMHLCSCDSNESCMLFKYDTCYNEDSGSIMYQL